MENIFLLMGIHFFVIHYTLLMQWLYPFDRATKCYHIVNKPFELCYANKWGIVWMCVKCNINLCHIKFHSLDYALHPYAHQMATPAPVESRNSHTAYTIFRILIQLLFVLLPLQNASSLWAVYGSRFVQSTHYATECFLLLTLSFASLYFGIWGG